jgi:hypothetical protein
MGIDIIVLLVVVLPGFAALSIRNKTAAPKTPRKLAGLRESVACICNGVPIIAIALLIAYVCFGVRTMDQLISMFHTVGNVIVGLAILSSITAVYGLAWGTISNRLEKTQSERSDAKTKQGRFFLRDATTSWEAFMPLHKPQKYVEVNLNGATVKGFTQNRSTGDENEMALILEGPERVFEGYIKPKLELKPDQESKLKARLKLELKNARPDETYINIDKNVIIHSYNLDGYDKAISEITGSTGE